MSLLLSLPPEILLLIADLLPRLALRALSQTSFHLRSLLTCIVYARTRPDLLLHFSVTNNHPLLTSIALYRGASLAQSTPENQHLTKTKFAVFMYDNVLLTMRLNASLDDHCVERYTLSMLHRAAYAGHDAIMRILLDNGADMSAKTSRGDTALHVAAERGHLNVVMLLLERGLAVNSVGWKGCTALHYAAMKGDLEVASVLIEKGADVNMRNGNGASPLHLAAWRGMADIVEFLVVIGADVAARDNDGVTALHYAAAEGSEKMLEVLLAAGAEKSTRDVKRHAPYDYACQKGHGEIARRLLKTKGANWRLLENLFRVMKK